MRQILLGSQLMMNILPPRCLASFNSRAGQRMRDCAHYSRAIVVFLEGKLNHHKLRVVCSSEWWP